MGEGERLRFAVEGGGEVSAILMRPANARWLLVLAHGAGAGMTHPFLERLARELASVGVATFRYQPRLPGQCARPRKPPRGCRYSREGSPSGEE